MIVSKETWKGKFGYRLDGPGIPQREVENGEFPVILKFKEDENGRRVIDEENSIMLLT